MGGVWWRFAVVVLLIAGGCLLGSLFLCFCDWRFVALIVLLCGWAFGLLGLPLMFGGLTAFIVWLPIVVWVIMVVFSCVVLPVSYCCCLPVLVWVI